MSAPYQMAADPYVVERQVLTEGVERHILRVSFRGRAPGGTALFRWWQDTLKGKAERYCGGIRDGTTAVIVIHKDV